MKTYEQNWDLENNITTDASNWAQYRNDMLGAFPAYQNEKSDPLANAINRAVKALDQLRPDAEGPAYLGKNPALTIDFDHVKRISMPAVMSTTDKVIDETIELFEGLPNWGHPLTMCNVIPQANTASIVAAVLSEIFSPNILEGEYSWNVHRAELESAGMLGNLFGWNPENTGCLYTYGGSGCWTYHVKYALSRVLRDSRQKGVRTDAKVICSHQAHYTMLNSTDWMGLGMDNIIKVRTDVHSNAMDLEHLEEILKECRDNDIPVASVVCTMGTTDANAFDPVEGVRKLLDKYPNNPEKYGKALLYCDSVVGWAWATFKEYDFEANPLQFSKEIIPSLKANAQALSGVQYADAIGVDFHKVGWSPYASSCFVYKDSEEFETLLKRPGSAYLQPRSPYNPLDYTLEVSRAATGSLAGWATMKYFGYEGFQAILGGILENQYFLRNVIASHTETVCVNSEDHGLVTLFRAYPDGVIAEEQYRKELTDPAYKEQLVENNMLTKAIGDKLYHWFREGKQINGRYTPYISFSTGFRVAEYNSDDTDPDAYIFALKIFPMNVHITPEIMRYAIDCVLLARDEVLSER
ncbi:pyridoxal phosphate-dependent decarboxylase family protein [Vibrio taketomensis]|uniref:pyridoxal phosphate-dependent decarboxylase family protein n=1 Tax=Vibrio taketomensis TaxID=2572923 RepID=UPI00138A52C2|nr:pyridoxal-dependent decarboxylase [Vibrio taketomensis]